MSEGAKKGRRAPKEVIPASDKDIAICTDGEISEMQIYLRNRFRMILGLPEKKLVALGSSPHWRVI